MSSNVTWKEIEAMCRAVGSEIAECIKASVSPVLVQNERLIEGNEYCLREIARLQQELEALRAEIDGRQSARVVRLAAGNTARH